MGNRKMQTNMHKHSKSLPYKCHLPFPVPGTASGAPETLLLPFPSLAAATTPGTPKYPLLLTRTLCRKSATRVFSCVTPAAEKCLLTAPASCSRVWRCSSLLLALPLLVVLLLLMPPTGATAAAGGRADVTE